MREPLRALAVGTGAALAMSLPAALVAQILDAVLDGGLPAPLAGVLALVVLAGPVAGGTATARRSGRPAPLRGALAGAAAIAVVALLGWLRRSVADDGAGEDVSVLVVPLLANLGALLGAAAGRLGAARAGRTRP